MLLLLELVAGSAEGAGSAVGDGRRAGDIALGLLLVGFLAGGGGVALGGLGNVVGGVLGEVVLAVGFARLVGQARTLTELVTWPMMPSSGLLTLGADMVMAVVSVW